MIINKNKWNYLLLCLKKTILRKGFNCPSCGSDKKDHISRKYFVTALKRCNKCQLLFRVPSTTHNENNQFYQNSYNEGYTTDFPNETILKKLISSKFINSNRDYSCYINILNAIGAKRGSKVIDFGCSWGYGSWQFRNQKYNVDSYEISKPRRNYAAKKLGANIITDLSKINNYYDYFFSSHVLEHVPSIESIVELAKKNTRNKGFFLAFTPNGSSDYRTTKNSSWNKLWGQVHPNFLDSIYYKNLFKKYRYYISSSPYDIGSIRKWYLGKLPNQSCFLNGGDELLVIVKFS